MRANQICTWMIFEVRRRDCLNLSLSDSYVEFWKSCFIYVFLELCITKQNEGWPQDFKVFYFELNVLNALGPLCLWQCFVIISPSFLMRTSWVYTAQNCPYFELQILPMWKLETLTNREKSRVWRIPKWLHASPPNICHHSHQCLNFGWKHRKKILHDSRICFSFVLSKNHAGD